MIYTNIYIYMCVFVFCMLFVSLVDVLDVFVMNVMHDNIMWYVCDYI